MRLSAVAVSLLLCFALPGNQVKGGTAALEKGQTAAGDAMGLQSKGSVKVPLVGTLVGKARCDDAGSMYVRFMDDETSRVHHGITKIPIEKINRDGSVAASFRIIAALPDISGKDFFVSGDGRVYQAGFMPDGAVYVAEFTPRGAVNSNVRLSSSGFIPYQTLVFPSGEFLLSGTTGLSNGRRPFTAVFDPRGRLIKEIYEPEDEDSRLRAEAGDRDFLPEEVNAGNTFVWRGDAALGSDGNAYLLRAGSQALVYVISARGDVVGKLRIDSPEPGLVAESIKSGPGTIAIGFLHRGMITGSIKVVDLQGAPVATYVADDPRVPGVPGCYLHGGFAFLVEDGERNIQLLTFEPKSR